MKLFASRMSQLNTITSNAATVNRIRKTFIFFLCLFFFSELLSFAWHLYTTMTVYIITIRIITLLVIIYSYVFGRLFFFDARELIVEFDNFSFVKSMVNTKMYPINQFSRSQILSYSFEKGFLFNTMVITRRKSDVEDVVIRVKFPSSKVIQDRLDAQLSEILEYNKNNPDPFVRAT